MSWRSDASRQPQKPFDEGPERQDIREATYRVRRREEQREALARFGRAIWRWVKWLGAFAALFIVTSNIPDAAGKLWRFIKGG